MAIDLNKDSQNRLNDIRQEEALQQSLSSILLTKIDGMKRLSTIQVQTLNLMKGESDLASKLNIIHQQKDALISKSNGSLTDRQLLILKELETAETFLTQEQKRKDVIIKQEEAQNNYLESRRGIFLNILGVTSDIEEAVLNGSVKALLLNKSFENISHQASHMITSLQDSVKELGFSVGSAIELQGNIESAGFSMTGLLYGSEAVAASGKEIADRYGNASAATSDLIKGVTQLTALTGDAASAVELAETFKFAGVAATDVRSIIEDIASKEGISAKRAMEGMADSMSLLVGKSEEQLKTIIKSNAALVKQGTNLKQIEDISNSMLDIEGSLRSEAKARVFLGRDINATAVRTASLALQTARSDDERAIAREGITDAIMKGVGGMEQFANATMKEKDLLAASYGMSRDDLTVMMQKKQVQDELTEKYGDQADLFSKLKSGLKLVALEAKHFGLEMAKSVGQIALFNAMQGKSSFSGMNLRDKIGKKGGKFNPFKSRGGGNAPTPDMPDTSKTSKSTGGLTKSISKINTKALLKGAAAMVVASAGIYIFAKAVQELEKVEDWMAVAIGLGAFAISMGIIGLVGKFASTGLIALSTGLTTFGLAMMGPGGLALAALTLAAIGLGFALGLAAPGIEAFGTVIGSVFSGISSVITSVADGIFKIMDVITLDKAVAMYALGGGLLAIAGGLTAMGIAGLIAMPGILAITTLSAASSSLGKLADSFGFGDEDDDSSNTTEKETIIKTENVELLQEIKGLRNDIKTQPIVLNIDGKMVSKISKVQSRQGVNERSFK